MTNNSTHIILDMNRCSYLFTSLCSLMYDGKYQLAQYSSTIYNLIMWVVYLLIRIMLCTFQHPTNNCKIRTFLWSCDL